MNEQTSNIYGVMGEFETASQLISATEKTREAGYKDIDAYAPYPVEGLSEALGLKRSWVPYLTLLGGLGGGLTGFGLQYWVNVFAYPLNIAGRPLNSWPAFIPVTFELTILGASTFAVFGMLALNQLPRPHHPVFNVSRFVSHASTDRFFLCIEATDPKFQVADSAKFLQGLSAQNITEVRDDD
jgi:Alternative complex III, ActD subunit